MSGYGSDLYNTVNPSAQVNDPANQVHCAGTAVPLLTFTTTPPARHYLLRMVANSNAAIGLAASGSGNLPAFTATNGGNIAHHCNQLRLLLHSATEARAVLAHTSDI